MPAACSYCGADDESVYMRRISGTYNGRWYLGQVFLCADCDLRFREMGATVERA